MVTPLRNPDIKSIDCQHCLKASSDSKNSKTFPTSNTFRYAAQCHVPNSFISRHIG